MDRARSELTAPADYLLPDPKHRKTTTPCRRTTAPAQRPPARRPQGTFSLPPNELAYRPDHATDNITPPPVISAAIADYRLIAP